MDQEHKGQPVTQATVTFLETDDPWTASRLLDLPEVSVEKIGQYEYWESGGWTLDRDGPDAFTIEEMWDNVAAFLAIIQAKTTDG